MDKVFSVSDQKGFTLIELISVMIILGVLASVTVKKFDLLSDTATDRAIQETVKELNIRESLTWINKKLSNKGWTNDSDVFAEMAIGLIADYVWTAGPTVSGGTLRFRSKSIALSRTPSTTSSVGSWI